MTNNTPLTPSRPNPSDQPAAMPLNDTGTPMTGNNDYREWERLIQGLGTGNNNGIDISIIIPIHDTPAHYLEPMMSSIQSQEIHGQSIILQPAYDGDCPSISTGLDTIVTTECMNDDTRVQVILVDDHSTSSDTLEWLDSMEAKGPVDIVRVPGNQLAGVAAARNLGLLHAMGRWVMYLDSDDTLSSPDVLESLLDAVHSNGNTPKIVIGDFDYVFRDGMTCDCRPLSPVMNPLAPADGTVPAGMSGMNVGMVLVQQLLTDNLMGDPLPSERGVVWGRLYDRSFLIEETPLHGYFDTRLPRLSDVVWNVMVLSSLTSDDITYVQKDIVDYKVRGGSITNGDYARRREQMNMVIDVLWNDILPVVHGNHAELRQWVCVFRNHVMGLCDSNDIRAHEGWFYDRDMGSMPLGRAGLDRESLLAF